MHHLPADLKRTGLAEVRRVLKPGGRLVIVDFGKRRGLLSHLALSAIVHHSSEHSVEDLVVIGCGRKITPTTLAVVTPLWRG